MRISLSLPLLLPLNVAVLSTGCFQDRAYQCQSDDQCLVAADGVCEVDRWCSYPAESCEGGRAYGPYAAPELAGTCLSDEHNSDGSDSSESSDGEDSETGPDELPVLCGNGVLDPGEECDDGNTLPGDECHPLCVSPGAAAWTVNYDGEIHGQDRAFAVALDPSRDAIYITGVTSAAATDDWAIVVQRWRLANGALVWSRTYDSSIPDGEDRGEQVAVDAEGNLVVAGIQTIAEDQTAAWLAMFDPDGEELWTSTEVAPVDSRADGVAVQADGRIVVVGDVIVDETTTAWLQWLTPTTDGFQLDGDPILRTDLATSRAIDVIPDGDGVRVTGSSALSNTEHSVWTASYDAGGGLRWEHRPEYEDLDDAPRGVGQALDPQGGSATAGVSNNNVLIQRFDATGMLGPVLTYNGNKGWHDEAADIGFMADGHFLVVGVVDFLPNTFGDAWVRLYDPAGEEVWTDTFNGQANDLDKALAVELTEHGAVVVGYETIAGQQNDIWIRHYAL